nr:conjugative transfer relaxase/helicase TraI domain-containing protein [Pantoea ananatis]
MRAFYISLSRAVDHVQIYTDGLSDWLNTLQSRDREPETAHDALDPQPERAQARLVWGMGKSLSKTAIGRTFLREQGLKHNPVTARIIPPTRKYPAPHLALPVFDGNGKTAGVSLYPLQPDKGLKVSGIGRDLFTDGAQAAIFQKSRNGQTLIVTSLEQSVEAARSHPETGVILQTGRKTPTAQLLKVAGGHPERSSRPDAALVSLVRAELQDIFKNLPADGPVRDDTASLRAALAALDKALPASLVRPAEERAEKQALADLQSLAKQIAAEATAKALARLPEAEAGEKGALSAALLERVAEAVRLQIPALPGEKEPDYAGLVRQAASAMPAQDGNKAGIVRAVISALADGGLPSDIRIAAGETGAGNIPAAVIRKVTEEHDRSVQPSQRMPDGLTERSVASAVREMERQNLLNLPAEPRGRERNEPVPEMTRNIQKER